MSPESALEKKETRAMLESYKDKGAKTNRCTRSGCNVDWDEIWLVDEHDVWIVGRMMDGARSKVSHDEEDGMYDRSDEVDS